MPIKYPNLLVFSDLDGTLLNSEKTISAKNKNAIKQFVVDGGFFTIATGRSVEAARRYIKDIELSAPALVQNGSVIYDYNKERIVYRCNVHEDVFGVIDEIYNTMDSIGIEMYNDRDHYMIKNTKWSLIHSSYETENPKLISLNEAPRETQKIVLSGEFEDINELQENLANMNVKNIEVIRSDVNYITLLPKGVNKGTSAARIAEMLGVHIENTVGIGDYYNDIDMLKTVGFGALTANAPQDIRCYCKMITSSCDEDAIKYLLEHLKVKYN